MKITLEHFLCAWHYTIFFTLPHLVLKAHHKISVIVPIVQIRKLRFKKGRARTGLRVCLIPALLCTNLSGNFTQAPARSPMKGPLSSWSIARGFSLALALLPASVWLPLTNVSTPRAGRRPTGLGPQHSAVYRFSVKFLQKQMEK